LIDVQVAACMSIHPRLVTRLLSRFFYNCTGDL